MTKTATVTGNWWTVDRHLIYSSTSHDLHALKGGFLQHIKRSAKKNKKNAAVQNILLVIFNSIAENQFNII